MVSFRESRNPAAELRRNLYGPEAHCIAVIHQGRVAKLGTHDELIARQGLYARLSEAYELASS
jgi:ABC-type transport system involved in cytochrome bd biosynthesis fused ATPase/permease subunit